MVDLVKLDNTDALLGAARRVPGLDVARFAIDLRSSAVVEAFGADMERARAAAREGERRVPFPSFSLRGEDGWKPGTCVTAHMAVVVSRIASRSRGGPSTKQSAR